MPDAYYQFLPNEITIQGQPATFYSRPALGDLTEQLASVRLLDEWVRFSPDARVLCMHCGTGLAGLVAARQAPEGRVTLIDNHIIAVEAARRTLVNQARSVEVLLGDCGQPVHGQTFDQVLAHIPKGRAAWQQTILDAAQLLRDDGTFYLAGANRSGTKSAAKFVKRVFGHVNVLGYRGGCRILSAIKTSRHGLSSTEKTDDYYTWRTTEAQVGGQTLTYATKPGLFSWKGLDQGTRLLLETLQAHPLMPDDRVWDIGCGSGPLALLAAQQSNRGSIVATDVDWRAEQATLRTAALNSLANVEVRLSDCAEALDGQRFGAVVMNPPFHQARATTYAITQHMVREAARLLAPSGRMYLVANSFLQYKPMIESAFGSVQLLADTRGFKVWHAART